MPENKRSHSKLMRRILKFTYSDVNKANMVDELVIVKETSYNDCDT